jgi:hypothetical protein
VAAGPTQSAPPQTGLGWLSHARPAAPPWTATRTQALRMQRGRCRLHADAAAARHCGRHGGVLNDAPPAPGGQPCAACRSPCASSSSARSCGWRTTPGPARGATGTVRAARGRAPPCTRACAAAWRRHYLLAPASRRTAPRETAQQSQPSQPVLARITTVCTRATTTAPNKRRATYSRWFSSAAVAFC